MFCFCDLPEETGSVSPAALKMAHTGHVTFHDMAPVDNTDPTNDPNEGHVCASGEGQECFCQGIVYYGNKYTGKHQGNEGSENEGETRDRES